MQLTCVPGDWRYCCVPVRLRYINVSRALLSPILALSDALYPLNIDNDLAHIYLHKFDPAGVSGLRAYSGHTDTHRQILSYLQDF